MGTGVVLLARSSEPPSEPSPTRSPAKPTEMPSPRSELSVTVTPCAALPGGAGGAGSANGGSVTPQDRIHSPAPYSPAAGRSHMGGISAKLAGLPHDVPLDGPANAGYAPASSEPGGRLELGQPGAYGELGDSSGTFSLEDSLSRDLAHLLHDDEF